MDFNEYFERKQKKKQGPRTDVPDNPTQPNFEEEPPAKITTTRRKDEVLYVAGNGKSPADIMFVMPSLLSEDAVEYRQGERYEKPIKETPEYMKCLAGSVLKDLIQQSGISLDDCYFTAMCKWLLPKAKRLKPDATSLRFASPSFDSEVREVKPKIVVCLGKAVFDFFSPVKYRADDIKAGWFYNKEYDCRFILLDPVHLLASRPDYVEKFRINLFEIRNMYDSIRGFETKRMKTSYHVINNLEQVVDLVTMWAQENHTLISVDCEWGGNNFIDGNLRTIQFCWKEGHACAIRFMDDQRNYVFDASYEKVGQVLGAWLNRKEVKYLGHHYSADAVWMKKWLNLEIYKKCLLDTEFAQQCCNEHADLGLDNLALKYTDLGRYDLPLVIWLKTHPLGHSDGYADIPDDLLLPYAMADVDVVMRAYPYLVQEMERQQLTQYYETIFNPFTTDVFTNFSYEGLPVDMEKLNELRDLYQFAKVELEKRFQVTMTREATHLVVQVCQRVVGDEEEGLALACDYMSDPEGPSLDKLKAAFGTDHVSDAIAIHGHYLNAPEFNIRAPEQMRRWLFDIKQYEPVKSTNKKEQGFPSMDWSKVKNLPKDVRQNYAPSVDKQSLQMFSVTYKDPVLNLLLDFNAVGNAAKAFLKPAEYDDDGELVKENGLHYWIAKDGRVHYNSSVTETARNRCWKPNILNWPSYVNKRIEEGVAALFKSLHKEGELPERWHIYLEKALPSIRSVVTAPEGMLMVESDYETAEIRGLAFISGDQNLIDLVTLPDKQFGFLKSDKKKKNPVRLNYKKDCGIPEENQFDKYILAYPEAKEKGKEKEPTVWVKITEDDLLRDENGNIVHPGKEDLHWSLAEMFKKLPREALDKKKDRDGSGKVGNFSSAYGASGNSLERKIEADTGAKPNPGDGQGILDALQERQPVATAYLEEQQELPKSEDHLRLASGRIRHWLGTHSRKTMDPRVWDALMSAQGRECRNTPLQESVASTSAIAAQNLLHFGITRGLIGRPMVLLYDAVVTLCPIAEVNIWQKAHELFMFRKVVWDYDGRYLNYPIETEINRSWSSGKLDDEALKEITTPKELEHLEDELEAMIGYYKKNMAEAVINKKTRKETTVST
jgi:uracil-DNA glycosylase family 4